MHRVVITGIGVISPSGSSIELFWNNLLAGVSSIAAIDGIPTERLHCKRAAQVKDFRFRDHVGEVNETGFDRVAQFAVAAARSAIVDSGIELTDQLRSNLPVILGTGAGGMNTLDDSFARLYKDGADRFHPMTVPALMTSACASRVSIDLGARGPAFCVSGACASGAQAISVAVNTIRSGAHGIAISGGTEACITVGTLKGWEALRVMSNDTCRPFSRTRSGTVLGEGACILILEELSLAVRRGARIYAEISGAGLTSDASSMTAPDVDGAARAMSSALLDSRCSPSDVDHINAHGTGTVVNDIAETTAIHQVFGLGRKATLPVSASKSILGHALGAAGALEAAVTALTIFNQVIPPTANFEEADPRCDLDIVAGSARESRVNVAISNSFAFGGLNATLVLRSLT